MHIQLKALLAWPHQLSEHTLLESSLCHAPPPAAHSLHEVLWPAAQNSLSSPYLRISLPPWPHWSISCSDSSPSPLYLVDFSCPGGRAGQAYSCGVHAYVRTRMWKPEADTECLPQSLSTMFLEAGSFTELGAPQFSYIRPVGQDFRIYHCS